MGLNKPVDFSTAKLLKEKGFDKPTPKYFRYDGKECENKPINWNEDVGFFSRPTIVDVIMWLYEKHGIWIIAPTHDNNDNYFCYEINFKPSHFLLKVVKNKWSPKEIRFNSPTEAYEAAIEYTLNNLI